MKATSAGRPSGYSKELAEDICTQIANSSKGLNILCKENASWPSSTTVRRWISQNAEFCAMYAQAKMQQADVLAEECLEIADDDSQDHYINEKGDLCVDYDNINRARLRVDTRKWLASKLAPKIYSDKNISEHKVTVKQEDAVKELE